MASYRLYATYPDGVRRELSKRPDLDTDPEPVEFPFVVGNEASRQAAEQAARERAETDALFDSNKIEVRLVLWEHHCR